MSFLAIILAENKCFVILDIVVFFPGFTLGHHSVSIVWLAFLAKSTFSSEIATRLLAQLTSSGNFWLKVDNWWQHSWTKSGQLRKYTQIHKVIYTRYLIKYNIFYIYSIPDTEIYIFVNFWALVSNTYRIYTLYIQSKCNIVGNRDLKPF